MRVVNKHTKKFREAVRIIKKDSNHQCLFDKYPQHHDLINSESSNMFSQGLAAAALKYASGFNVHGIRDCAINENVIYSLYPRCSETEDWDHVVKYTCAEEK